MTGLLRPQIHIHQKTLAGVVNIFKRWFGREEAL
jgi:hypothetical protein